MSSRVLELPGLGVVVVVSIFFFVLVRWGTEERKISRVFFPTLHDQLVRYRIKRAHTSRVHGYNWSFSSVYQLYVILFEVAKCGWDLFICLLLIIG